MCVISTPFPAPSPTQATRESSTTSSSQVLSPSGLQAAPVCGEWEMGVGMGLGIGVSGRMGMGTGIEVGVGIGNGRVSGAK